MCDVDGFECVKYIIWTYFKMNLDSELLGYRINAVLM